MIFVVDVVMWKGLLLRGKKNFPPTEAFQSLPAKLSEASLCLLDGLLSLQVGLAEEFVGVADDLLLPCLGHEVLVG